MPWLQKKSGASQSDKTHEKPYWYIRVPTFHGTKAISTGTSDKRTAKNIEAMVDELYRGKRRDHEILEWLLDRTLPPEQRLKPLVLYRFFNNNQLEELKARRKTDAIAASKQPPADANAFVEGWYKGVRQRSSVDHADRFLRAVRSFMPADVVFGAERFDYAPLVEWHGTLMEAREQGGHGLSAETARRYRVGLYNFIEHLVRCRFIATNHLDRITPPKYSVPRDRHLSTPDAIRLIHAFEDESNEALQKLIGEYGLSVLELQAFNALLSGAGVEVSVALGLQASAVWRDTKEVFAPGTKTHSRKRVVRVADWAWPWVEALARIRRPGECLFMTIPDRWIAAGAFNAVIKPLAEREPGVFADYWMRDGRHTYAVRAIKAGTPPIVVATQLGHKNAILVLKVYGIYVPGSAERDYWEAKAAERDRDRDGVVAAPVPSPAEAPVARDTRPANVGHTPKIQWPTVEELLGRLKKQSAVALAKELGVSDKALRKHLLSRGVKKLPDGRRSRVASPRTGKSE